MLLATTQNRYRKDGQVGGRCAHGRLRGVGPWLLGAALLLGATAQADPNPASIHSDRGAWPLYRQWNAEELQHFARWIENIFDVKRHGDMIQRLAKIEEVLTDPEMNLLLDPEFRGEPYNPQLPRETMQVMHRILDCGKLTVSLTGYYSYIRGLPFMISWIRSGDGGDIRTSSHNDVIGGTSCFDYNSAHRFFIDAVHGFNTGHYRIEPDGIGAEQSHTVPVAITRESLLSGSMFYFDGHVLILAKVDDYGELHFLDSTTAPTRGIYYHNTMNAVSGMTPKGADPDKPWSGCYRGFRIHRYPIAETDEHGRVTSVRRRTDAEMAEMGYSLEQYEVLARIIRGEAIVEDGVRVQTMHDFVRLRMRKVSQFDPVAELKRFADEMLALCEEREQRVQAGWQDVQSAGPVTFPERNIHENVFNARGRWGDTATAAFDVDLRLAYFQMLNFMDMAIDWYAIDPGYVAPSAHWGNDIRSRSDLAFYLIRTKSRLFAERSFNYTNSRGESVTLTLADVEARLFDMSFDPNHAPALRWGALLGSEEAESIIPRATPLPNGREIALEDSYARQAYYRALTHREQEQSYLEEMFTEGFPKQQKFTQYITAKYRPQSPPPLLPWYAAPIG